MIEVRLNGSVSQIIRNAGINGRTALFAAGEARRLMHDYVPMKTGALCDKVRVFVENGRGVVFYAQPYAGSCYYGDRKNFSRDKHEKASAYWDRAMVLTYKGELTERVKSYIKGDGR